jgi:hypothetical protein
VAQGVCRCHVPDNVTNDFSNGGYTRSVRASHR